MRLRRWGTFLALLSCAQAPALKPMPDAGPRHDAGDSGPPTCGGAGQPCCHDICDAKLLCTNGVCGHDSVPDASNDGDCPFVLCHGVCTDVDSDPKNCGVCGHDCQGTLCNMALCNATGVVVGTSPMELVVDSTHVYFTDGDGTVNKVVSSGGTAEVLATGVASPFGIGVDTKSVYFTAQGTSAADYSDGAVLKVPLAGLDGGPATPTPIASGRPKPQSLVVDATQVYWLEPGTTPTTGALLACPLAGCPSNTPDIMVDDVALPYGLAVDSTSVYVTASGSGQIIGVDKTTAAIRVIAMMQNQPEGITVANGMVYWASNLDGTIQAAPVAGDAGSIFIAATMGAPQSVAADAVDVYWSDTNPMFSFGPVEACSVSGAPSTLLKLVGLEETATNIAIDSLFVYWIDDSGQILRVAK
jgi:hypothetical protein